MMAVTLLRPGEFVVRPMPVPEPGEGELVLRVETALTCGTDVKTFRRGHPHIPLPSPMGHEASGVVAAVGKGVSHFREGDAVACVPTVPCGQCRLCRRGRDSLCAQRVDRINLGAFAEYLRLPAHIVEHGTFPRPAQMGAEAAAALEPLACVVHGANRIMLDRAESVVFIGDGPIALLFVQVARLRGVERILLAGRHPERMGVARQLGVDATTGASGTELQQVVRAFTGGTGADVVVECVGTESAWAEAHALAARAGEVLLFGGRPAGEQASFDAFRIHYDEVDVKGAFHFGRADAAEALQLLECGDVRIEPLVTHRRRLADFAEAFQLVLERKALKVAIEPGPVP